MIERSLFLDSHEESVFFDKLIGGIVDTSTVVDGTVRGRLVVEKKIDFFCSAFYPEAVTFLKSLHVKKFKIASRTCLFSDPYSFETINHIGTTKKPTIISMGMGGWVFKTSSMLELHAESKGYMHTHVLEPKWQCAYINITSTS